jgi:hypothetical protein
MFRTLLLITTVLSLNSCVSMSSGTPMDEAKISRIRKGVTTRAELEKLLGPPAHVSIMPNGQRALSYFHSGARSDLAAAGPMLLVGNAAVRNQTQTLDVRVSSSGIVQDYEFNNTSQLTKGGFRPFGFNMSTTNQ